MENGGHYIVFVARDNHRCDFHKLSRLLRYKQVRSQSVVGTFKIAVKNHSREPVSQRTTSQDAPTISRARRIRSERYVRVAMYNNRSEDAKKYGPHAEPCFFLLRQMRCEKDPIESGHVSTESLFFSRFPSPSRKVCFPLEITL